MLLRILLVLAFLCDLSVESIACDKRCLDDLQRQIDRMNKSGADAKRPIPDPSPRPAVITPLVVEGYRWCPSSRQFFPTVQTCPEGWKTISR